MNDHPIKKGLYVVDEVMPYHPSALSLRKYALPDTLGDALSEEAAARVLYQSTEQGFWVGVSWSALADQMTEDVRQIAQDREIELRACRRKGVLNILTLGVYGIFKREDGRSGTGQDVFSLYSHESLVRGIVLLRDRGLLRCEEIGKDSVFFPTPSLLNEVQGHVVNGAPR